MTRRRALPAPVLAFFIACAWTAPLNAAPGELLKPAPPAHAQPPTADIGFIGLHGGVFDQLASHAGALGLKLRYFEDGDIAARKADLASVRVLYVQHTREEDREAYRALLTRAVEANPTLKILSLQSKSLDFFRAIGVEKGLTEDKEAPRYYGSSSENHRRLLAYTAAKYLGRADVKVEPPQEVATVGLYHPDRAELFNSVNEFTAWRSGRPGGVREGQPRVLVAVHATHLTFQQPKVVDALVRELEKQGALAAAIIDGRSGDYTRLAKEFGPDAVIHTCHSMDALPFRLDLDVPHLHSIFFRKQSIGDWLTGPVGLSSSETAFHIVGQELIGGIEPQAVAGTKSGSGSAEAFEPIPERVEHLVRRAIAQAKLRRTPKADKRVAVVYYDREMGKGELMRGSSTGMHMNAPRSLLAVLAKMREHGYRVDPLPRTEDEVLGWMMNRGKLVGVWAPGELARMVKEGSPVLIPAAQYRQWYERRVPPERRAQVEAKWGPPPGKFMVWADSGGQQFIVVPRIDLGNVILLPQPLRGEAQGKEALNQQAHDKTTTPPHNYLATYFWLEEGFKANAVVHFGTHGSEFALPGKPSGLSNYDWPDVVMGGMPNFNPWIIENMVESAPVRRRVYGTLISHLPPPIVNAGLSDDLATLHETIDKWELMEEGGLKDRFAAEIGRQARGLRLDVDLKLTIPPGDKLDAAAIGRVNDYLHSIAEETTPTSLHVLGQPPRADLLPAYMVNVVRGPFLKALETLVHGHTHDPAPAAAPTGGGHLKVVGATTAPVAHAHDVRPTAERIMKAVLIDGVEPKMAVSMAVGRSVDPLPEAIEKGLKLAVRMNADFARTTDEIDNLLKGLDGRFVPPGPGNSPIRNPNAVPTGRNMYLLNPDEVPMRPSWELGRKMADELIAAHQKAHNGQMPTKIGFDLRSSATFRDYGVMEGQILALMGVEPVYDEKNLVADVRLIPRAELGRPRVDVFIATGGWYESNLPGRLNLWDKAVRLVAAAAEPDNPIYANTQALKKELAARGVEPARAALLAPGRIFGIAPGREGTTGSVAYTVERSGDWTSRDEIARQYLAAHKFVYTEGAWGEPAAPLYDAAIQGTHTVVRSWSDYMTSPLSSRYTWLQGGALTLAVEQMTGKRPEYVFNDVRDPDKAGVVNAEDALRKEYHVRLFNRRWLEGMMKEGYAGADHMRFLVSNSFGWEVMRPGSVGEANWQEMKNVLVDDKLKLSLREWFERTNPYAYQDATATLIEAVRKGYWNPDAATRRQLAQEFAQSVARHGLSGSLRSGGNKPLDEMVRGQLESVADAGTKELVARYAARVAEAAGAAAGAAPGPTPVAAAAAPNAAAGATPPAGDAAKPEASASAAAAATPTAVVQGVRAEMGDASATPARVRWWWIAAGVGSVAAAVAWGAWRRSGTMT